MSEGWLLAFAVAALVLLAVCGLAVGVRRAQARTATDLAAARAEAEALRAQLARLEARVEQAARGADSTGEGSGYVITGLDTTDHGGRVPSRNEAANRDHEPAPIVEPRLFADLVLRETTVRAATVAQGLRRALAPESRNRIRFEMKREVKRARKQRRAEMRATRREWQARKRAGIRVEQEGSAA